jgi:SOS-response transcriptional repressor LexA
MNLAQRIQEAIAHSGKNKSRIAAEVGVSPGAVTQWLTGGTKGLKAETAEALEKATGVRSTWLVTGKGVKFVLDKENVAPASIGSQMIPLISYVRAGAWAGAADPFQPNDAHDWLMTDLDLSDNAFALEIKGDSMLPDFRPGDRVIIDPHIAPQPGDCVVAKNGEEEATFKKYRPRGIDQAGNMVFELVPLNDDYPIIRSDITPVHIIGTMVEHRKYRRRP